MNVKKFAFFAALLALPWALSAQNTVSSTAADLNGSAVSQSPANGAGTPMRSKTAASLSDVAVKDPQSQTTSGGTQAKTNAVITEKQKATADPKTDPR